MKTSLKRAQSIVMKRLTPFVTFVIGAFLFIGIPVGAQTIPSVSPWFVDAMNRITQRVAGTPVYINGNLTVTGTCTGCGGGGAGTISTSSPLVAGQVDFSTGVNTIGNDSTFLFDSISKKLTATYASTTAFSSNVICFTGDTCRTTWPTSSGNVATSTSETAGQLAYWTSTGATPATLGKVATSSIGAGTGLSFSGTSGAQVGGTSGTFSVNTTQNITTLSNLSTAGTVNTTAAGALYSTATSSVSAGTGVTFTGTAGALIGGTSLTINTPWTISGSNISNNNSGNVGLGTTTPQRLLTISTSTAPQILLNDGGNTAGFVMRSVGGNFYLATSSPTTFATSTLTSLAIVASTTGSLIGINQSNPRATLDLFENGGVGASPSILLGGNAGGDTDFWVSRISNNDAVNNDSLQFGTTTIPGQGSLLTLTSTGNFGVGTTSPYSLFSVGGNVVVGASIAGGTLGDLFLPKLAAAAGAFLAVDTAGKVIATTTPSGSGSGTVGSGTIGQFPYYAANGTTLTATSTLFVSTASSVGIGTTTPKGTLGIQTLINQTNAFSVANAGGSNILQVDTTPVTSGFLFSIASSTNTGTQTYLGVDAKGHEITSATSSPVISSCGTSPTVVGNDNNFEITVGSVSATSCTATFVWPWTNAPVCTVTEQTDSIVNALSYTISTTQLVVSQTGLTSAKLDVICRGYQ